MASDLPLVGRGFELSVLAGVIESAAFGRGHGAFITGESGIGKTRLLREARTSAEDRGLVVLRGRAIESGGAYRPIVEAFARPATAFADRSDLAAARPALARILPGWVAEGSVVAPMADPAAVLAAALVMLLQAMAPHGAALILDDLQWADPDTLSVLASLVDVVDTLPLALVFAARSEASSPALLQLAAAHAITVLPLARLTPTEVASALRSNQVPSLASDQLDQLVTIVDGLPLVMDEFIRQIRESGSHSGRLEPSRSTLVSAVQVRLDGLSEDCRLVLDALSVIGDADAGVVMAATGLEPSRLRRALHEGLASTLLVAATNALGLTWRHILIGEAVRRLLLPLEQQAIARRAADRLARGTAGTDGQFRQAARLYELAGYPQRAAEQLIRAARLAVNQAALDLAQQDLSNARALSLDLPQAGAVLIQTIETLLVAGRAADAYELGRAALGRAGSPDTQRLLIATARAAYAVGVLPDWRDLLAKVQRETESADARLAALRVAEARSEARMAPAADIAEQVAVQAEHEGLPEVACEALVTGGESATWVNGEQAIRMLHRAVELSRQHGLIVWEVAANAQLGLIDRANDSDTTRLEKTRSLATTAGMVGTVVETDAAIAGTEMLRRGFVAALPQLLRVDNHARQLHLTGLHQRIYSRVVECYLMTDLRLPGTTHPPGPADIENLVAGAVKLAESVENDLSVGCALGGRAWLYGDSSAAIGLIQEELRDLRVKVSHWWGFAALLRVVGGDNPARVFKPVEWTGHHANWAARAIGMAVWQLRAGQPADAALAEAERYLRRTPFWAHVLRTVAAPAAFQFGFEPAEGWLREADAFFGAAGERPLQRRVRKAFEEIGRAVPRNGASVPAHLARFGITVRETEVLRLVNAGLSNTEIAQKLFISTRTVETHVRSMLRKAGVERRDQLPLMT